MFARMTQQKFKLALGVSRLRPCTVPRLTSSSCLICELTAAILRWFGTRNQKSVHQAEPHQISIAEEYCYSRSQDRV